MHHFFHVELNILWKINELLDEQVIKLLSLLCNKKIEENRTNLT